MKIIGLIIALSVIGFFTLSAQEISIYEYNAFDEPVYFRVVYSNADREVIATEPVLLQPGEEHFFGNTIFAEYYMTCYDEAETNYLVETDVEYTSDEYTEYYITRKIPSKFYDNIAVAGNYKWREPVPGGFNHHWFEVKRKAYLLNDTNLAVKMVISDYRSFEPNTEKWLTIEPGEKLFLGDDYAYNTSVYFYGTSESSSGTTYYYAGDTFLSISNPSNSNIEYYAAAARLVHQDNYSDCIYKLSSVERNDWVSSIEIDLSSNQKVAISYYDNGEWIDRVCTRDISLHMDGDEYYFVFLDDNSNRYFYENGNRISDSTLTRIMRGSRSARLYTDAIPVVPGSTAKIWFDDGNMYHDE
jgi:hypothetical protein